MIFRVNTGQLIEIKRDSYTNNTEYYAKIIKAKFNKIMMSNSVSEECIVSMLKKDKTHHK